jgi:hypothetical protein
MRAAGFTHPHAHAMSETPSDFLLRNGDRRGWDGDKSTTTNGMGGVE